MSYFLRKLKIVLGGADAERIISCCWRALRKLPGKSVFEGDLKEFLGLVPPENRMK